MDAAALIVIIATLVAVVAVAWVLLRQGHPESSAGHLDEFEPDSTTERLHGYSERPAGADAEDMGVPDNPGPR